MDDITLANMSDEMRTELGKYLNISDEDLVQIQPTLKVVLEGGHPDAYIVTFQPNASPEILMNVVGQDANGIIRISASELRSNPENDSTFFSGY